MAALWGGRFEQGASEAFARFNASLPVDWRFWAEDIQGSQAWAGALADVGVLTQSEAEVLQGALGKLAGQLASDPSPLHASSEEDIHSFVESWLINEVGDLGKKLHTGRSRNDQVATDFRLWCRNRARGLLGEVYQTLEIMAVLAEREHGTLMPGYTHLQRAQPVTFGHWVMAYAEMLERDAERLEDAIKRVNVCPLGCGALAGTAYPIDRDKLAKELGFDRAARNSLDAISDRDFVLELLQVASTSGLHLSRLAEDLIFFGTGEAGFVKFSDTVSSGSSLMPQKKNPDALELIRGKSGRIFGSMAGFAMTVKALPLSYNKDLQEDKNGLFDALDTWSDCLLLTREVLATIEVNKEACAKAAAGGYSNATELADYLVAKGIPFREAHHMVGVLVRMAIEQQLPLEALPLAQMRQVAEVIEDDVYLALDLLAALEKRCAQGGVSLARQQEAIKAFNGRLAAKAVRRANLEDVDAIVKLIGHWAGEGENLPRSREDIIHSIQDFVVADVDGKVAGCASLYIYSTGLAEIRSLGLNENAHGKGLGQAMVQILMDEARSLKLKRVIVLTRVAGFFDKQGFKVIFKDTLPEKVMKDCKLCPRQDNCDEIAMEHRL
ncbi:MAG: argininosuccinate lyase [Pseudomonadota bacterium]|uniref:argininosuccinate lyase n=1 Tax=Gallaecimonas pentaromativorans TaxID=584787 RepID=UPI00067ED575|nr:argininosuccinate lyase [Gallaecimonas pentaromativorans]MED5526824.1 argininosuccinate lyase [Pseudomonadota bacterium]